MQKNADRNWETGEPIYKLKAHGTYLVVQWLRPRASTTQVVDLTPMLEKEEKAKDKLEAQATQGVPSPDLDTDADHLLPHTFFHGKELKWV